MTKVTIFSLLLMAFSSSAQAGFISGTCSAIWRLLRWGRSETHSAMDKFENPVKMVQQGIRELKKDLQTSLVNLAQVKSLKMQSEARMKKLLQTSEDYEKKATLLLTRAQKGELDSTEADRLAAEVLRRKRNTDERISIAQNDVQTHQSMVEKLMGVVNTLKSKIEYHEEEMGTLNARYTTAQTTRRINENMSQVDSGGTIAMLDTMRDKVTQEESLAKAYGEIAELTEEPQEIDQAIDKALGDGFDGDQAVAELKARIEAGGPQ